MFYFSAVSATAKHNSIVDNNTVCSTRLRSIDTSLYDTTNHIGKSIEGCRPLAQQGEHWQEWLDSCIHPQLIALNLESVSGGEAGDRLFYSDQLPRRNDGRLTDSYLRKFQAVSPGWWVNGVHPLTDQGMLWGCFKPDDPRQIDDGGKTKKIKYEHPYKEPTGAFFLRVSLTIWLEVSKRSGVAMPDCVTLGSKGEALGFWRWVIEKCVPVTLTEGVKKAAALLSHGYAAIALPGIWNGYRKEGGGRLIPLLELLATKGREVIFAFDQDVKPKTIENVQNAIDKTGRLFEKAGCKVSIISWDSPEKGIDDFIVAQGTADLHAVFETRMTLKQFKSNQRPNFDLTPSKTINVRYLEPSVITPPVGSKVIGIQSPKGTGKTQAISQLIEPAQKQGTRVIVLVHREQLAKELSQRFGVQYRTELTDEGKLLGYALCIDSLHPFANPSFKAEKHEDCILIIDECEQVIWHLLHSSTCKNNRTKILEQLPELFDVASQVYLLDADLSQLSIDYVVKQLDEPTEPWVLVNNWKPEALIPLFDYPSREALLEATTKAVREGEKILIVTGAQKAKSTYGSTNLEIDLKKIFPDKKILRLDSVSITTKDHPAYGVMGNLNEVLPLYDIVIASPVLETGVSLNGDHFDRVVAFGSGVQTVNAFSQSLARVREGIPRHIYTPNHSPQRIGNGSDNHISLLKSQERVFEGNLAILGCQDAIAAFKGRDHIHMTTYTKIAARLNFEFKNYGESIRQKLEGEGYQLIKVCPSDSVKEIKEIVKETAKANHQVHCEAVADAPILEPDEFERIQSARAKTSQERLSEQKTSITMRYATNEVTPELVDKDEGGFYSQLQIHYYLTVGRDFLAERDRKRTEKLAPDGKVFTPDLNSSVLTAKVNVLDLLGFNQFLDLESSFTNVNLQDWFDEKILPFRRDIKDILGISIHPKNDTPIAVAQRLLSLAGLKLTQTERKRLDGKQVRLYRLIDLNPDGRDEIFERWLERERCATPCATPPQADDSKCATPPERHTGQGIEAVPPPLYNINPNPPTQGVAQPSSSDGLAAAPHAGSKSANSSDRLVNYHGKILELADPDPKVTDKGLIAVKHPGTNGRFLVHWIDLKET